MADVVAQRIVQAALQLRASHPAAPALAVLDEAMASFAHSDPDFYTSQLPQGTWLIPRNDFANVLRDAFDPLLSDQDLERAAVGDTVELAQRWVTVVDMFARRYDLWRSWRVMPGS